MSGEMNKNKLNILINHMLHHNIHHSEEIAEIAETALSLDCVEIAEYINKAKQLQDKANDNLKIALELSEKEI